MCQNQSILTHPLIFRIFAIEKLSITIYNTMKKLYFHDRKTIFAAALTAITTLWPGTALAVGENDPASVVEQWSNAST